MSPETPENPDEEIQDILSGLGDVLKDITGEAPPPPASPPRASPPAARPPAAKPSPAAKPPPAKAPPPAGARPPAPAKAPPQPRPEPADDIASGIELAPRAGILGPAKKAGEKKGIPRTEGIELRLDGADAPPPANPIEPPALKRRAEPPPPAAPPPMEIVLESPPGPEEAAPSPEPPPDEPPAQKRRGAPIPAPSAPPETVEFQPPPRRGSLIPDFLPDELVLKSEAPRSAAPPPAAAALSIPSGTPKEQVRRVAFVHAPGQVEICRRFAEFLGTVALKVSKKPLYLDCALFLQIGADLSSTSVVERVKASRAVATIGILAGLRSAQAKDLEEVFEKTELFFRVVAPDEVDKRPLAIDLVVDIMLLKPEG